MSRRFSAPDSQVLDAADQFAEASRALWNLAPGSGVAYPAAHNASISVELYLKAMSAQRVETPLAGPPDGVVRVSAEKRMSAGKGHALSDIYEEIPPTIRADLESRFTAETGSDIRDSISATEGVFTRSRYPFEAGSEFGELNIVDLVRFASALGEVIHAMPRKEWTS